MAGRGGLTGEDHPDGDDASSMRRDLVELERSSVRVDARRQCRGVWLDRGELDRIVEEERRVVAGVDDDEDDFVAS